MQKSKEDLNTTLRIVVKSKEKETKKGRKEKGPMKTNPNQFKKQLAFKKEN